MFRQMAQTIAISNIEKISIENKVADLLAGELPEHWDKFISYLRKNMTDDSFNDLIVNVIGNRSTLTFRKEIERLAKYYLKGE